MKKQPKTTDVVVTVDGGVAEVHTCPANVKVTIVDYDNLRDVDNIDDVVPHIAEWIQKNDPEYWDKLVTWCRKVAAERKLHEIYHLQR